MILLVGGDSVLAGASERVLRACGQKTVATTRRRERVSPERPYLDLASLDGFAPPADARAACLFAGIARMADCAADPAGTASINVVQTLALIERILADGLAIVFLSSNRVFDGSVPHVAADAPFSPLCRYGEQKARVESALLGLAARGAPVAILRVSKVVSPDTELLRNWTARLARGLAVDAFHDLTVAPVAIDTVAGAIAALLCEPARGVFQLSGPRDHSYADVARLLARGCGAAPALVNAISARNAGLPRPGIAEVVAKLLPHWLEGVR